MAATAGLKNRNGRWTLRVRVPDRLRQTIGKREISKSFGSVSYAEASRLARIERAEIDRLFEQARKDVRSEHSDIVSDSALHHLTRSFLEVTRFV